MKLTIVGKRPFEFTGSQGDLVRGNMYVAFSPSGKALEFSSREEHEVHEGEIEFNAAKSEEVTLQTKIRQDGKVGYREAVLES